MTLVYDAERSEILVETIADGLLSALAHDLHVAAPGAAGSSEDGASAVVRFPVSAMKVVESRRHGKSEWHPPSSSDARDIEGRIRDEVFSGVDHVEVRASLDGGQARIEITGPKGTQSVTPGVAVAEEDGRKIVTGSCELSLAKLGTGKPRVPMGAIKLKDAVTVRFRAVFAPG